jgi:hypothetical protein
MREVEAIVDFFFLLLLRFSPTLEQILKEQFLTRLFWALELT